MTKANVETTTVETTPVIEVPATNVKLSGAVITKADFPKTYAQVVRPVDMKLVVSSVSREMPISPNKTVLSNDDGRELMKHIINLKAVPNHTRKRVIEAFKGVDELDLAFLNGLTLTVNAIIPASGDLDLPFKGQTITVSCGYIEGKGVPQEDENGDFRDDNGNLVDKAGFHITEDGIRKIVGKNFIVPAAVSAASFSFEDAEIELPN